MWIHKLVSVLALISMSQANIANQNENSIVDGDEDQQPENMYVLENNDDESNNEPNDQDIVSLVGEDGVDTKRFFVISKDATPTGTKVNAGFQIFKIPIGPQFTYTEETEKDESTPPPKEVVKPVYIPVHNDGYAYATHDREEIIHRVPVKKIKQHVMIQSREPPRAPYPWEHDTRGRRAEEIFPGEPARRSDQKVTAGLQLFGYPLGPQFSYKSKKSSANPNTGGDDVYSILGPIVSTVERMARKVLSDLLLG